MGGYRYLSASGSRRRWFRNMKTEKGGAEKIQTDEYAWKEPEKEFTRIFRAAEEERKKMPKGTRHSTT